MGKLDNDYNPDRLEWCLKRQRALFYAPKTDISPFAYIGPNVQIGDCCRVKPFTSIGAKGFSWAFREDGTPEEMVHTGGVIIGNYVEIGALCTIPCGTIENTIIGDYVKIDDQVHTAHNTIIGEKTCIAGGTIFGGGVRIGKCVWIGLNATVNTKVTVGDWAVIGSGAMVIKDVPPYAVVAGVPARILRYRNVP